MRRHTIVVALMIAAACGGESLSLEEKLVGEYNLISIDGKPLPYSYVTNGLPVTIVSRQLLVLKNGPFATAYWTDSSVGTIVIDGRTRPRSASGPLTFVNLGDTLVLTSSQSVLINIPSFNSFIQDHRGGMHRIGEFNAELYHR